MTTLAKLNNIHLEVRLRDNFSVLLCHSNELCHVLHASNRLADLTCHRDQRLATVSLKLAMFVKVRALLITLVEPGGRRRKLHQICDFILVNLQHRAVN